MVLLAGEANPSSANPNPKEFWRALSAMCCVRSMLHARGGPLFARLHDPLADAQVRDDDLRDACVGVERAGVEADETVGRPEIERAVGGLEPCVVVEFVVQQSVGGGVGFGFQRGGREADQPLVGGDPEVAAVVLDDPVVDVARQVSRTEQGLVIDHEIVVLPVVEAESRAERRRPDAVCAVAEHRKHLVARQRARIVRRIGVAAHDRSRRGVVADEPVGVGGHPQVAGDVFGDVGDEHALEDGDGRETVARAVVAQHAERRAHEQIAFRCLVDGVYLVVVQARRLVPAAVYLHRSGFQVQPVEPLERTQPQLSVVVADAEEGFGKLFVPVFAQLFGFERVGHQSRFLGGDPEPSFAVVGESPHEAVGQRFVPDDVIFVEILVEGPRVVHAAGVGADPDAVGVVYQHRERVAVREREFVLPVGFQTDGFAAAGVVDVDAFGGGRPQFAVAARKERFGNVAVLGVGDQRPDFAAPGRYLADALVNAGHVERVVGAFDDLDDVVVAEELPVVAELHGRRLGQRLVGVVEVREVEREPALVVHVEAERGDVRGERLPPLFHEIVFQRTAFRVAGEEPLVVDGHPDHALPVFFDGGHLVVDHRAPVAGRIEGPETVGRGVVEHHAAVGADPDVAPVVLAERDDESGIAAELVLVEGPEPHAVVAVEAVRGPQPDESPRVLDDGVHAVVGESAVGGLQMGEIPRAGVDRPGLRNSREKGQQA